MIRKKLSQSYVLISELITILFLFAAPASAATIWTDWTSATLGAPGSASGLLNSVAVSYTGEVDSAVTDGSTGVWAPDSSFIGGTVTTSPSSVGDVIFLNGSFPGTNTIAFFTSLGDPVSLVNPVFAIWSLGNTSTSASFIFDATPTFEAGGPNSQFGGQPITVSGNTVSGSEGNGVVQFTGTFSSISWTNTFENFYGFTVGIAEAPTPVPAPSTAVLFGTTLAMFGLARRRRAV